MFPICDGTLPVIPAQPTPLAPRWAAYPWVALVTPLWGMVGRDAVSVIRVLYGGDNRGANVHGVSGVAVKNSVSQAVTGAWVLTPFAHAGYTGAMTDFALAVHNGADGVSYDYVSGSYDGNGIGIFLKHTGNGGRCGAYIPGLTLDGVDTLGANEPVFLAYTRAYPTARHQFYRDGTLKATNTILSNGTPGNASGGNGPAFGLGNLGNQAFSSLSPALMSGRIATELTQIEIQQLLHDLRTGQFFAPAVDISYFDEGASTGTSVSPTEGHTTFTGYTPNITAPVTISAVTGTLLFTGYVPSISQTSGVSLSPIEGHLTLAGYAPSITQNQTLSPVDGHAAFTGYVPSISQNITITVSPVEGHLTFTGSTPTLSQPIALSPVEGHLYLGGYAPVIDQVAGNQTIAPASGSIFLQGYAPSISQDAVPLSFSSPSYGGGGGGKRWWKEIDGDRKVDEVIAEWEGKKAPEAAKKPGKKAKEAKAVVEPAPVEQPLTEARVAAMLAEMEQRILAKVEERLVKQLRVSREEIDAVVRFFGELS